MTLGQLSQMVSSYPPESWMTSGYGFATHVMCSSLAQDFTWCTCVRVSFVQPRKQQVIYHRKTLAIEKSVGSSRYGCFLPSICRG